MDKFNGIDIFFNSIKEKCSSAEEYATELLKARGFLLEDEGLILSDNSHKDDAKHLNQLLIEENLGEVKDDGIIIFPNANVEKIFYKDIINGEAVCYPESWKKFAHNSFAPKVPVNFLEPFVARYVKAISACGVKTWCSCDGNHPTERNFQRIIVAFTDTPNGIWHKIIFKKFLAERFKNLKIYLNNECLKIIFEKADKWQTYIEINRAGKFLYDNRIKFRKVRRESSNRINNAMAKNLSSDELSKIFSDCADKLLDNLFTDI